MSAPLLIEHLLDTTAYSIDHVEVYQGSTQTFIAEVSSDNFKSLILNSKNKMPSLHIGDCRHVGYDIIFLVPTERVLQILYSFHSQRAFFLWVLAAEVLF